MSGAVVLESVELIPVLEVSAFRFSTRERALPTGSVAEMPDAWHRFWLDSLADSDITDLEPSYPGSSLVPVRALETSSSLGKILAGLFRVWDDTGALAKPASAPALDGGLILRSDDGSILVEPGCCSDLGNISSWRAAANYRKGEWEMVWVGHPWVSVRYEAPWLHLSQPHETDDEPVSQWSLSPDALNRALVDAEAELERFALQTALLLPELGNQKATRRTARKLAGLGTK